MKTINHIPASLIAALLLSPVAILNAAEIYVATNGGDQAAGTLAAPLQTIQAAFDKASAGDTILLREGTYREAVALKNKSGKDGAPITLKAYPGEKPVLSGLDVLNLEWKATPQTGVFVAAFDAPAIAQLFFNGKPMLEARWPNCPVDTNGDWNFFSPDAWAIVDKTGCSYGTIADSRLAATGWNVTGAQTVLNVDHQYWCWTRKVQNHSVGSKTFNYDKDLGPSVGKTDEGGSNPPFNDDRYYLFGMRQFLDAPGEWFHDVAANQLYFYAPDGKSPATGNLEIKTRDWGFTADQNCNYLTIDSIEFFGTAFKFGKYNKKCSFLVFRNNRVLHSSWTEYLKLPKGQAGHEAADVIYPTIEADHAQVLNNTFAYGALSALYINGFDNLIENNVFHDFCYNSSLDYAPLQVSKPWPDKIRIAGRATVRHNTFYRSGGIQVHVAQAGNDFYLNDLHDSFLACYGGNKDTSALYIYNVFCKGTRLHHNWVHRGYSGTPPLPWGGGEGIRGDDKTCGLTVDHNVTWDLGACGIEIKNVDNPKPKDANRCVNNTVFNHSAYNPVKSAILMPSVKNNWNIHSTVANNLADSIYGWWFGPPVGPMARFSNNDTNFVAARDLVSPAWFDFRPASGATAIIGRGVAIEGLTGKTPDIGAYDRGDSVYWIPGQRLEKASCPIVPDMAKNVPVDRDVLMWKLAYRAVAHTVYFSTSKDEVQNAAKQALQKTFRGEENVFPLPKLAGGQTYFWRVDATLPDQSVVKGDLWTFSTK